MSANKKLGYFVSTATALIPVKSKANAIKLAKNWVGGASVLRECECGCGEAANKALAVFNEF